LREPGFDVTQEDLAHICTTLADWLSELPPKPTLAFAGSVPPSVSPDDFAALLRASARSGGRIVLDTNGPPLRAAVQSGVVDTVKPNLEELSECLERPVSSAGAVDAATELLAHVNTVLLTLGQRGAYLVREGTVIGRRCPLSSTELQNTVGCGDAFLAGWLLGEQMGADAARSLCWAVAAGAASAMSETSVGYTLADAEALLPRCEAATDL
jgi:fructose-1-phosphate kinase PfkB-like protein